MKFFHLSDLHIGKYLNGYNLADNQRAVLQQIVSAAAEQRPDALLICGDIYDKTAPSGEAYTLFDGFLGELSSHCPETEVIAIAGNHDSPERLSYAAGFLARYHIHIAAWPPREPDQYLQRVTLADQWGPVHFYMLPFLKPGYVRKVFETERPDSYESAVRAVLEREKLNPDERNVLMTHQFYISGSRIPDTCDSEQAAIIAGGLDHIDVKVLEQFDYAALGHLHGRQKVGRETVRYCGTPYKYSVSEADHHKAITVVTLTAKDQPPEITFIPLQGHQDVRREKGELAELLQRATEQNCHDFISVTLTDELETYNAREQLEEVYDHLLEIRVDNSRTRKRLEEIVEEAEDLTPGEAFTRFYEVIHGTGPAAAEAELIERMIAETKEVIGE